MTQKEAIVKYITEMNVDVLSLILENNKSFMNLFTDDFLFKLQEIFSGFKKQNITEFSKVLYGISEEDSETRGIEGCKFITSDKKSLTLLFEEYDNEVIEIYNCDKFRTYQDDEDTESFHISIFLDERTDFIPTFEYIILTNKIEDLCIQYGKFRNKITPIENANIWYESAKHIYDSINLFKYIRYKFYYDYSCLVVANMFINFVVENKSVSSLALKEYNKIDIKNKVEVTNWLLKYKYVRSIRTEYFEKFNKGSYNSFVRYKEDDSIIFDCSNFESCFEFDKIYNYHMGKIN